MKQLILLRHAKSSWADPNQADFDRPLNARGERDAPRMGAFLRDALLKPDYIVTSPARRALQTAELLRSAWGKDSPKLLEEPRIYEASTANLQGVLESHLADCDRLMLVGHNPGISSLLSLLTGVQADMPTCSAAVVALRRVDEGMLCGLFRPKRLWPEAD
ncbi:MAG: histidine phosphatase family protein [Gammaproteobacteria bacterium]|nr:MAG: histidine phosphatase family protein [Gammaproteobacteria bacterium]